MAILSRFRLSSLQRRYFSSILSPDSSSPLRSQQKSRAALSLLKTEKNPERVIDICRAASLTPMYPLDRKVLSDAVSKLVEYNYFEGIRSFLEELKTRPDLKNERFLSYAIILYGQAGMLDNAIRTFETIHEMGFNRTVASFNALLLSCIFAKKHGEVKRIFVEFPERYGLKPDIDTYNTVIRAFCESGSSSTGYSILAEMERNGFKPNATSFGTLISGFYKEEKYDDVGKVLEMMKKDGMRLKVSTYNIRIKSLCKLKKSGEAKALLDGMLSKGMKPNTVTYCHLIQGFCKEGNLDEAKKLFKRMVYSGCKPDSECYYTLVYFLCHGGDFVTALEICRESLQKNWVPNFTTMKSLVNGLASISKIDEARELVGLMKEKFPNFADRWVEVEEGLAK